VLLRLVAGLSAVVFIIFALSTLFNDDTDPLSTRAFFSALLLILGGFFLSFASRVRRPWVAIWFVGWVLSVGGALQVAYSYSFFKQSVLMSEKFGALIWALISPAQIYWGAKAVSLARRASTPIAQKVNSGDQRRPVLFLRRFCADSKTSVIRTGKELSSIWFNTRTEEELIAEVMNEVGVCVAVGRPGERMPQLGFSRIYVSDDKWQDTVLEQMRLAQLVILMAASSSERLDAGAGFLWELQNAVELVRPERLLFLIPADRDDERYLRQIAQPLLPRPLPDVPAESIFPARSFRAVLYFTPDWTPCYARPGTATHFRRTLGQAITPTLKLALRPVYAQLGLGWKQPSLIWARILYEGTAAVVALCVVGSLLLRLFDR
jgi:hypothetical protein